MPHFIIAGYLPADFDPASMTEAQVAEIHQINRDMVKAGIRRFAGGLGPSRTVRPQKNGEVLVTDGPFLETKEQIGGLSIIECASVEEALSWARRGAKAGGMVNEVREIFFMPAPEPA